MGHANLANISSILNRELKKEHGTTIKECVSVLLQKKQTVHASEGEYDEPYMLSDACEEIIYRLFKSGNLIEPIQLSQKQKKILKEWKSEDLSICGWDCGDDGNEGEYAILDSIRWKATAKRLSRVEYITR